MAISATYGQLQEQIALELGDKMQLMPSSSGVWSPIKNAVQSAIAKWERTRFYFNEFYDTVWFTTVSGQEVYTASDEAEIGTAVDIIRLRLRVGTDRFTLVRRPWEYIDDISVGQATTGKPEQFAYFAQQVRLYPIPDDANNIAVSGVKRLTALTADADANAWTQDAFSLIRCEALMIIATEYLHNDAMARAMEIAIYGNPENPMRKGYLAALQEESLSRDRPAALRAVGDNKGRGR